jgi:hypothetical protein
MVCPNGVTNASGLYVCTIKIQVPAHTSIRATLTIKVSPPNTVTKTLTRVYYYRAPGS